MDPHVRATFVYCIYQLQCLSQFYLDFEKPRIMHSIVSCVLILCSNGGPIMLSTYIVTYIVTINAFKTFHSSAWVTFLEVEMVLNNGVSSKGQHRDMWRWRVISRCPQALMTGTLHSGTERWLHILFREFYYPILSKKGEEISN